MGSSTLNDQRDCAVRTTWLEGYWTPPAATSRACACECSQRVGHKETVESSRMAIDRPDARSSQGRNDECGPSVGHIDALQCSLDAKPPRLGHPRVLQLQVELPSLVVIVNRRRIVEELRDHGRPGHPAGSRLPSFLVCEAGLVRLPVHAATSSAREQKEQHRPLVVLVPHRHQLDALNCGRQRKAGS